MSRRAPEAGAGHGGVFKLHAATAPVQLLGTPTVRNAAAPASRPTTLQEGVLGSNARFIRLTGAVPPQPVREGLLGSLVEVVVMQLGQCRLPARVRQLLVAAAAHQGKPGGGGERDSRGDPWGGGGADDTP